MQPNLTTSLRPPLISKETVIAPVLRLEEQLASARTSATEALLEERRCIDAALQKIGYDAGDVLAPKKKGVARVCTICGESGHNARKHKDGTGVPGMPRA